MTWGARQLSSSPAAQFRHRMQALPAATDTRSPGFHTGTSGPTASTTPDGSCPSVSGGTTGSGVSPGAKGRAGAQIPPASMRTTTSQGPGNGGAPPPAGGGKARPLDPAGPTP